MKALSSPYLNPSPASGQKCCPSGHPLQTDPVTGRSTCSCQLQQTTLPAYLSRVPSLPETIYAQGTSQLSLLQRHMAASALYQSQTAADDRYSATLKAAPPSAHLPYHYEHLMAAHPYSPLYPGFDINGMKRKNATRESTSALKAWLYQHRKNPYPTKAEKVMLAIVSQMTLTQVSTWFANARRRLKKENKMEETDLDLDDIDTEERTRSSRHSDYEGEVSDTTLDTSKLSSDNSDNSDVEEQTTTDQKPAKTCVQRLFSPDSRSEQYLERLSSPDSACYKSAAITSKEGCSINIEKDNSEGRPTNSDNSEGRSANSELDLRKMYNEVHRGAVELSKDNVSFVRDTQKVDKDTVREDPKQATNKIWSIANIIG